MKDATPNIPVYGSMKRPSGPDAGLAELKSNLQAWAADRAPLLVEYETDEFTSLCPSTGQPDFNTIIIMYDVQGSYIESKSMKFYLWSFRDHGMHCEHLAARIAADIMEACEPNMVTVVVKQKPRGGLALKSTSTLFRRAQ